jgi:hypothetical protein
MPVHVRIHSARRKDLTRFRLKHHSILSTRQSAENCRRNLSLSLSLSLSLVPLISPPGWLAGYILFLFFGESKRWRGKFKSTSRWHNDDI